MSVSESRARGALARESRALRPKRGAVIGAGLIALALWLPPGPPPPPGGGPVRRPVSWQRRVVAERDLAAVLGVRLVRVTVSGGGGLLDLRYQVLDAAKAHPVHDAGTPPAIVDEATGLVINQLYMNHGHSGEPKAAVTYYLVFENPGGWVRRGSAVTILLGDAQVEHVLVR